MNYFKVINTIIKSFLIMAFAIIISTFHSCNPLTQTDSTYSLTGRMLKDCSGEPYANYSLTFYIPGDGMLTNTTVLGTVNTDDKGYFKLSNIPSNKSANVHLKHTIDANYVTTWGSFNIPDSANIYHDGTIYDLGDYYGVHTVNTLVKLSIDISKFQPNDSIIIGIDQTNFKVIHPIIKTFIYTGGYRHHNINLSTKDDITLQWGIGKRHYDSVYNELISPEPFEFKAKLNTCSYPDTTYYNIP